MLKKNNLLTKYIKLSVAEGWKLQNVRSNTAAFTGRIEVAIQLCYLFVQVKYSKMFSEYDLKLFKNFSDEEYQRLIEENSVDVSHDENPGVKLFQESFEPLADLIAKGSDKDVFFGDVYKDRFEMILAYYPEYAWLKQYHMEMPHGADLYDELSEK
ncbi:MAG: hypothetical protein ABJN25_02200, partial [Ekhidna sp.]